MELAYVILSGVVLWMLLSPLFTLVASLCDVPPGRVKYAALAYILLWQIITPIRTMAEDLPLLLTSLVLVVAAYIVIEKHND